MKRESRKKEELDRIGTAILAADRLRDSEVEEIASAPHLLASVKARIAAEAAHARPDFDAPLKPAGFGMPALVLAAAAVLIVTLAGLALVLKGRSPNESVFLVTPPDEIENATPVPILPEVRTGEPPARNDTGGRPRRAVNVQASFSERRERRPPAKPKPVVADSPLEFYALAPVGETADALKDGHIVSVDLPRGSLVSLGVSLSLASDNPMVRTDLLVGSDGVTKAIRVVK